MRILKILFQKFLQYNKKRAHSSLITVGIIKKMVVFLVLWVFLPIEAANFAMPKPISYYLNFGLSQNILSKAMLGFEKLKSKGMVTRDILTIVDFTQSSNKKRLYLIDMNTGEMIFNTLVAHGKNTGEEFAKFFSNNMSSYQSSLGFYVTGKTYQGEHGLSLKLRGVEPGINHLAEERAIVMHGADYVSEQFIKIHGRLGRSFGCPAIPYDYHRQIIELIKNGSCLFLYANDATYLKQSTIINTK